MPPMKNSWKRPPFHRVLHCWRSHIPSLLSFVRYLTYPGMLPGNFPWTAPICYHWMWCSSTCDIHVYIPVLRGFWRHPCLPAAYQRMENSPLLRILDPFPSGQTGYWSGIRRCTSLASRLDSVLDLRAWFGRTKRIASPSTPQKTCFHTPSPYLFPPLSTDGRWLRRQFSWGDCSCFWLGVSHVGCSFFLGLLRRCLHAWGWEGYVVDRPNSFGGTNGMFGCSTYCCLPMATHSQPCCPHLKSYSDFLILAIRPLWIALGI